MGGRKSDDYKGRHLLSQDGGGCHVRCGKMSLGKRISNQISVPKRSSWLKFEARVEVRTPRGLRSGVFPKKILVVFISSWCLVLGGLRLTRG